MSVVDGDARGARGRVVMLVDNGVNGDSRVQKAARSADAAGWDVVLLGRSPDDQPRRWLLGQARVRLIPTPAVLEKRRHEFRRRWLLAPLAYPPNGIAAHRTKAVAAWFADIEVRRAILGTGTVRHPRRAAARLRAEALAAGTLRRWVGFRCWLLASAQKVRRRLNTPWDRAYAVFWRCVLGDRAWRRLEPGLWDYELAYGPVIDELAPDLIHAHDFRMLGVGARAALRGRAAGRAVKLVWDAHEYVPGLKPWRDNARWLPAHSGYEREYARYADAVVTVSAPLADLLHSRHGLAQRPVVVLNAPAVEHGAVPAGGGLRERCGIGPEVPLLVYSGVAASKRGLDVMVEALPELASVHVALVVNQPTGGYLRQLVERAAELGVQDRLHVLPYVPYDQVVPFLAAADAGVIPIQHWPNHEIALITKFFEYAHARLPLVVSDVRLMAQTTRESGLGEVFRAGDAADYARAVTAVLADPQRYRAAYRRRGLLDGWTWEAQAKILDEVYSRLVEEPTAPGVPSRAAGPDVTVVVAVYNAMPYLTRCLTSLVEQSIGRHRMQIVAVDDGSTDGSGRTLDRFARNHPGLFTVVHQANSGGPAAPSNRGLERATGRYVFFIGADDHLAPDALQRMVAAADEHGSDVVAAKMVGLNGRYVPKDIFTGTQIDVDLFRSRLPYALSNTKLFRRELIERYSLRFPEDLPVGSDQPFTLEACVRARRITVLSDADYYYATRRRNDSNITYRHAPEVRLRCAEKIMDTVARLIGPGPQRDAVICRHFSSELANLLQADFLRLDRARQDSICAGIGRLVTEYLTEEVCRRLDVSRRLRLTLAQRGEVDELVTVIRQDLGPDHPPVLVEGDRLYCGYRCFRDARLSLPDGLFLITDTPAESVARRLQVTAVGWVRGAGGGTLTVSAYSPVELTGLGPEPVHLTIGSLRGEFAADPVPGQGGTAVRARFAMDRLLAQCPPLPNKERREVRAQVDVYGATCDVALRLPSDLPVASRIARRGYRPYRVKPTRNRDGHLVLDIVPVTPHRIIDHAQRVLRRRRKQP